jgi:hypothetical protein
VSQIVDFLAEEIKKFDRAAAALGVKYASKERSFKTTWQILSRVASTMGRETWCGHWLLTVMEWNSPMTALETFS